MYYALVDANNFYASCEKIFRPDLANIPLVVLSNNDGCIVARSKEAKALGIDMAVPYFKVEALLKKHNVAVFSSNYALYGDISQRMITILESFCEEVEQYSIDEAFLNFNNIMILNKEEVLRKIRERVHTWLGIQVSIGLAQTRTLAKLANYLAKKQNGLYFLDIKSKDFEKILANIPVGEVWGIGRQSAKKLQNKGINNALQLQRMDDSWVRKNLTISGWNTVLELRGIPATDLHSLSIDENKPRKSILSSRSFAKRINKKSDLEEALSHFATKAAQKLRKENMLAQGIEIHIRTPKQFDKQIITRLYAPSFQFNLHTPTADTRTFLHCVKLGLEKIYKSEHKYSKAGIMLFDLAKANNYQASLLTYTQENTQEKHKSEALMAALDTINNKFGQRTINFGAEGKKNAHWHMKQEHKSPDFTGKWKDLALAKCI